MTETTAPTTASDPRLLSAEGVNDCFAGVRHALQAAGIGTRGQYDYALFNLDHLKRHIAAQSDALDAAQQQIAALEAAAHALEEGR